MTPATRARPTFTSADLVRNRGIGQPPPVPTGAPITGGAMSVTSAAPQRTTYANFLKANPQSSAAVGQRPVSAATRAPLPPQPDVSGLTGFARENTLANAGVYQPGTFAAQNAAANGTGRPYQPPQQTERANPLTGDSNRAPGGSTTGLARTPFVQRGAGVPQGQDAIPAPVQETESEDATIGGSMQGTMNRLRGTTQANPFARRFGQPSKQSAYDSYLRRVMPT